MTKMVSPEYNGNLDTGLIIPEQEPYFEGYHAVHGLHVWLREFVQENTPEIDRRQDIDMYVPGKENVLFKVARFYDDSSVKTKKDEYDRGEAHVGVTEAYAVERIQRGMLLPAPWFSVRDAPVSQTGQVGLYRIVRDQSFAVLNSGDITNVATADIFEALNPKSYAFDQTDDYNTQRREQAAFLSKLIQHTLREFVGQIT